MNTPSKEAILKHLISQLEIELNIMKQATNAALEAATHEENRAENQYDTRGLEASYLAAAQQMRSQEIETSLQSLKKILNAKSQRQEMINIGSLIELIIEDKKSWLYLLPFAAGTSVKIGPEMVTVVSSLSPIGKELMGKKSGDSFLLKTAGKEKDYEILQVF